MGYIAAGAYGAALAPHWNLELNLATYSPK